MPSIAYLKNKQYVLKWNENNKDKVREWARNHKRGKDLFKKEWKSFCNILL